MYIVRLADWEYERERCRGRNFALKLYTLLWLLSKEELQELGKEYYKACEEYHDDKLCHEILNRYHAAHVA